LALNTELEMKEGRGHLGLGEPQSSLLACSWLHLMWQLLKTSWRFDVELLAELGYVAFCESIKRQH
jgi:hypothetical protein